MKSKTIILSLMALALAFSSCVPKKQYQALLDEKNALSSEKEALEATIKGLQSEYHTAQISLTQSTTNSASLEQRLEDAQKANRELKAAYAAIQKSLDQSLASGNQSSVNIAKLVDEINASNRYIKQLVEAKSKSDSLNLVLTNKLTRSLTNSELKDVDVKVLKGVVYISLSDNMLYKSGSYEISNQAMEVLSKIAKIIKDYDDYDVLIEGNTDNVPISRTNIRNNWDLSCLRASSVVQALQNNFGVNPARLTAGGRGEFNPMGDNDTEAGRSRNRRTEIIITPKLDDFLELIDQAPEDID